MKPDIKSALRIASKQCLLPPMGDDEIKKARSFVSADGSINNPEAFDTRFNILEREHAKRIADGDSP